jgi:Ca2+-binding RTX toxin-like protein
MTGRTKRIWAGVLGAGLVLGLAAPAGAGTLAGRTPTHDEPQYLCRGIEADIVVGPGESDVGTVEDDVIVLWGTNNEINANPGDDLICVYGPTSRGDYGHTTVEGSQGNDRIFTYGGINILSGFDGNDTFYLGGDSEAVEGGNGNDHIWGNGSGNVTAHGDAGFDLLVGSPSGDFLAGDDGNDLVIGGDGNDTINGDAGNDYLLGGMGYDTITGGADYDHCEDTVGPVNGAAISQCEDIDQGPALPLPEAG